MTTMLYFRPGCNTRLISAVDPAIVGQEPAHFEQEMAHFGQDPTHV
jgi:hypothetical protein